MRAARPALPVLYMSGYAQPVLDTHGPRRQIDLLEKPFSEATLLTRVRHAIDNGTHPPHPLAKGNDSHASRQIARRNGPAGVVHPPPTCRAARGVYCAILGRMVDDSARDRATITP